LFKPAAVVAGLAIAAGAAVGTADAQTGARPPAVSAALAATTSRTIFLATGEKLLAHLANASNCVGIVSLGSPSRHGATALRTMTVGALTYAFPEAAMPYVNHGLDSSLFNVGAVAAAETGGRLPVRVTYSGKVPSLPGLTITGPARSVSRSSSASSSRSSRPNTWQLRRSFRGRPSTSNSGQDYSGGEVGAPQHFLPGEHVTDDLGAYPLSRFSSYVQFTLKTSEAASLNPLSTATSTTWSWPSSPPPAGAKVPTGWTCLPGGQLSNACAVEPMMTLRYGVVGESLGGTTSPGPQVINLSVGHLQLARGSEITSAKLSVSFDGGTTWHPAAITGSNGSYAASFNAPADSLVSLRATASDANGSAVTETITNAYQVAYQG
jgi:hypothetical protein